MATPPNSWVSNSGYNKFKASYINGECDVSQNIICRNGNLYLAAGSSIYSPSNQIFFNEPYQYTNFQNNVHIYGTFQLDRSSITYDVGYSLENLTSRITNISYNSGTNTTSITGNLSIPAGTVTGFVPDTTNTTIAGIKTFSSPPVLSGASITASTIPDTALAVSYVPASTNTTIAGIKTFSSAPVMSGASITASTIPDTALAVSYVPASGATTIAGIKTFSSAPVMSGASITASTIPDTALAVSYVPASGATTIAGIKTFSSAPVMSGASISSGTIPNSALVSSGFVDLTTSQLINTGTKTWTANQVFSGSLSLIGNLILNTGGSIQITNAVLRYLTGITSDVQTQFGACAKLTANTFTGIQTFSNNIIANSLTITPTVLGYLSGVTSSIQTQINSISTSNFMDLISTQTASGLKTFSSLLTASAGFASTAITASTSLQVNSTSSTGSIFAVNQANSTQGYLYSGVISGGGATDYSEGLVLRCGNYGLEIQGGIKQTVGDTFNIGFNNGGTFINVLNCVNTGTPATNILSLTGQLNINSINILNYQPVGTILTSVNASVGAPFLACDGTAYSRTTYAALYAVIGIIYGIGDGSTTFNIPNFRGCFLRGNGSQTYNSVSYSAASVGTPQADALQDHTHAAQSGTYTGTTTVAGTNGLNPASTIKNNTFSFATTGAVNSGRTATETRPFNNAVYYYIRY